VGTAIALLFHDRGTRRGWVVSSKPRPHFTPGKDPVPILQEAGWAPQPVWTGGKSRPQRNSIPNRPALSQSLYWLSYPAQTTLSSAEAKERVELYLYSPSGPSWPVRVWDVFFYLGKIEYNKLKGRDVLHVKVKIKLRFSLKEWVMILRMYE